MSRRCQTTSSINRPRGQFRGRGLTLIELLAAVVILSAVAAAFASVARDASVTLRESSASDTERGARLALSLWEAADDTAAQQLAELARTADERGAAIEREWLLTIDGRETWRVAALAPGPAPGQTPGNHPHSRNKHGGVDPAWGQRAVFVTLLVWREGDARSSAFAATRMVPLPPAPRDSPNAGQWSTP